MSSTVGPGRAQFNRCIIRVFVMTDESLEEIAFKMLKHEQDATLYSSSSQVRVETIISRYGYFDLCVTKVIREVTHRSNTLMAFPPWADLPSPRTHLPATAKRHLHQQRDRKTRASVPWEQPTFFPCSLQRFPSPPIIPIPILPPQHRWRGIEFRMETDCIAMHSNLESACSASGYGCLIVHLSTSTQPQMKLKFASMNGHTERQLLHQRLLAALSHMG
jgi:hypothetical protein